MKPVYLALFLALLAPALSWAQRPDRSERSERRGGGGGRGGAELKLKAGESLPEVSGYDEEGKPFHLRQLKGKHAVMVFGCLT